MVTASRRVGRTPIRSSDETTGRYERALLPGTADISSVGRLGRSDRLTVVETIGTGTVVNETDDQAVTFQVVLDE